MKTHEFYPVDINFVHLGHPSADFQALLEKNPFLGRSFDDQFIIGSRYSYTLNTQVNRQRTEKFSEKEFERSQFYFNGTVDVAGNLMHGLQNSFGNKDGDPTRIFGKVYSQFVRGEIDFRYYLNFDKNNRVATRLDIGTGYAYGNSRTLPYIKQFSIGGSNSLRAFPARTVGPGTYNVNDAVPTPENSGEEPTVNRPFFIDQRADIKLEGNAELRFNIIKFLKGAVFVDAGNIWLIREDPARPGGVFKTDQFLDQLAVGTGAGLRMDFNYFLLRFDLAFPIRKPYLPEKERWVLDKIDLASPTWRGDNFILNIAIGYPF